MTLLTISCNVPALTSLADLSSCSGRSPHVSRSTSCPLYERSYQWLLFFRLYSDAGISTIVYLILLVLLSRQVARSSSAAGLSRVSRYTFLVQSLVDAISFVGVGDHSFSGFKCVWTYIASQHITLAILADGRPSLAVLAPGGLACMLFIYEAVSSSMPIGMQLLKDTALAICCSHRPDPSARRCPATSTTSRTSGSHKPSSRHRGVVRR